MEQAVDNVVKSADITRDPAASCGYSVPKEEVEAIKIFVLTGGSLIGGKGQQRAQEQEEVIQQAPEQRRPPACSTCR